ncbi:TonB-dependent receptor [Thalassotalea psychrophila]|uniref:TonB-dependent receptor n=1 Tax=Thalassotalea psychrophila TaxID=3065647 RepID=A0ABY9U2E8_9GAMM|nr:TonB-dependent receptor [Colwelliaceae bacterium SQ149]
MKVTNTTRMNKSKLALAIGASMMLSGHVMAQGAASSDSGKLEVIQVTATKRTESIQDVPMSITAINGDKIEKAGIDDLSEMSGYIPNLTISEGAINTNIYMRGVGSGINRAFEQSVGMFVDGIYMGRGKQFRGGFLDLERAEVLRGPQGVLFGKNTIAGTINTTTAKAEAGGDFEGKVTVDIEPEYGTQGLTAVLATGLTDEFGVRLAVKTSETDGYMENTYTNRDEMSSEEDIMRLSAHWAPSANLDVHMKVEHSEFSTKGTTAQITGLAPLGGLANFVAGMVAPALDDQFNADKDDYKTSTDQVLNPEMREVETDNVAINIDYSLGDGTLTFVTGYSAYDSELLQDVDFMPVTFINTNDVEDFSQVSQEIRYATSGNNKFDYITGIYYQENELDFDFYSHVDTTQINPALMAAFAGVPAQAINPAFPEGLSLVDVGITPNGFTRTTNFKQETDSLSAFFQGTYNFTDDFRIIAGGRYTEETKDVVRRSMNATLDSSFYSSAQNITPPASAYPSPELNGFVTATLLGVAVTDPEGGGSRDENQFIPSVKFQYDVNDNFMVYGGAEQGFKSGGFNANADATDENNEFEEEKALGLEIGFKSDLLDGRARLNMAVFHTNFEDLQVTTWNGFAFEVGNAAESVSQGIEVDGSFLLTDNLTLSGSFSYLDSYYEDYANGPCSAEVQATGMEICDLTDETTPFAPELSSSLFLDYITEIGTNMELFLQLNVNYMDDVFLDTDLDPNVMQEAHTKVNARIALASIEETWELALIGKNLTDETTFSAGLDVPLVAGGYMGYTDAPRTVSVQGTYRF